MSPQLSKEIDHFIHDAYVRGLTIVETIKLVKERFHLALAQAKEVVATHPDWRFVLSAAEPLQKEIFRIFQIEFDDPKR